MQKSSEWLCVQCSAKLGNVYGGEFYPSVDGKNIQTRGVNLAIVCPSCGATKVWFTSDPIVRSINQLIVAISEEAARAMVNSASRELHKLP